MALTDRRMKVKFNGAEAGPFDLIGGAAQGSLIGQIFYTSSSYDNTVGVNDEDKFQYIDDLSVLEVVYLSGLLIDYDFHSHVASDIAVDQRFLPPGHTHTQSQSDAISQWTDTNLAKLNASKSNYIIYTRMKEDFAARITLNGTYLERQSVIKILGVWISDKPGCWEKNTKEIIKTTYSKLSILTKLKHAGMQIEDLIQIYCLLIKFTI